MEQETGVKNYTCQSVEKPLFAIVGGSQPHFVFPATGASEKPLVSENRLQGGFQGCVGGIGGSRVQSENPLDFRRAAFPPREWLLCRRSQTGVKNYTCFFALIIRIAIWVFASFISFEMTICSACSNGILITSTNSSSSGCASKKETSFAKYI